MKIILSLVLLIIFGSLCLETAIFGPQRGYNRAMAEALDLKYAVENNGKIEWNKFNEMATTPIPYVYPVASVLSVYDGDTITCTVDLGFNTLRKISVRVSGVDAPEVTGSSKVAGLAVRDYVRYKLGKASKITLESKELDKYGRSLGIIHLGDGTTINELLLKHNMALPYNGESRVGIWNDVKLTAAANSATAQMSKNK